jgi:hypothetical protein
MGPRAADAFELARDGAPDDGFGRRRHRRARGRRRGARGERVRGAAPAQRQTRRPCAGPAASHAGANPGAVGGRARTERRGARRSRTCRSAASATARGASRSASTATPPRARRGLTLTPSDGGQVDGPRRLRVLPARCRRWRTLRDLHADGPGGDRSRPVTASSVARARTVSFTVACPGITAVQEALARLNYLPYASARLRRRVARRAR